MKNDNLDINNIDLLRKLERLTFVVLIGFVILTTISFFIFNYFDSQEHEIKLPL